LRLESMNDFRRQLERQENSFATKDMLRPFEAFHNKFFGMVIAVTVLNAIITALVMMVLKP